MRRTVASSLEGNAYDLGPPLDLAVKALDEVGRVQLSPVQRTSYWPAHRPCPGVEC